jgi:hypothetical protein
MVLQICTRSVRILEFNALLLKLVVEGVVRWKKWNSATVALLFVFGWTN